MDERLIDDDRLPVARRSVLPGEGFFYPDSLDERRADERAERALDGATAAVVTDTDADGLACAALVRAVRGRPPTPTDDLPLPDVEAEREEGDAAGPMVRTPDDDGDGEDEDTVTALLERAAERDAAAGEAGAADAADATVAPGDGDAPATTADGPEATGDGRLDPETLTADSDVALLPSGPGRIAESLARFAAFAPNGTDLYVCDLCPDDLGDLEAALSAAVARAGAVRWFDHHRWDDATADAVRAAGVELVVGASDEECSADVALRSLDHDFPDRFRDLAAVTRDHDLWIKEDERSDDLADYAYWVDDETYVETVRAHGADLPGPARAYLERRRVEKRALIDRALARAELREVGPWTVGVTYGRCSQNEVAEGLREEGADAAVVVKPSGSASIRGSESFERAHEVAGRVDGGGHPRAAGCKPDVYDDMLDYAHHWSSRGAVARRTILDAFRAIAPGDSADDEDAETGD